MVQPKTRFKNPTSSKSSKGKGLWKKALVVLAFVAGLSYFAFTLLFFDPFEARLLESEREKAIAIEYTVPRTIDFFAHKRGLIDDIDVIEFPVPRVWRQIETARTFREFAKTPLYAQAAQDLDLGTKIDELRAQLNDVPLLSPLDDVIGIDCAVFGRVKGRGYDHTEVALAFFGTGATKFAWEAAASGFVRSFVSMPFEVEDTESGTRKFAFADGKEIYGWRNLDFFVVSSGPNLVGEVKHLVESLEVTRDATLGFARRYAATVAQDVTDFAGVRPTHETTAADLSNRIQLHANLGSLLSLTDADEAFLEPRGEVSRMVAAKMFNPNYFDELTLDIGVDSTIDVRGMLGFDKDKAEATESGFYDRKTFELQAMLDNAATRLPEDTWFVMAARVDMKQFLPTLVKALTDVDPDTRKTLDDVMQRFRKVRADFRPTNAMEAAQQLAMFLGDDIVFALRRDTYLGAPQRGMPIIALFFQVTDRGPSMEVLNAANGDPTKAKGFNGFVHPIIKSYTVLGAMAKWFEVSYENKDRAAQDVVINDPGSLVRNVSFGILDSQKKESGPWTLGVTISPRADTVVTKDHPEGELRGTGFEMLNEMFLLSRDPNKAIVVTDLSTQQPRTVKALYQSERYQRGRGFLTGFASVAVYLDATRWRDVLRDQAQEVAEYEAQADRAWWDAKRAEFSEQLMSGEFAQWRGKTMPPAMQERFDAKVKEMEEAVDAERVAEARKAYEQGLAWVDLIEDAFLAARIDESTQNIELRAKIRTAIGE